MLLKFDKLTKLTELVNWLKDMLKGIINMQNNQKVIPLRPERRPERKPGWKPDGQWGNRMTIKIFQCDYNNICLLYFIINFIMHLKIKTTKQNVFRIFWCIHSAILHSAFCFLHSAILHSAFCILHFAFCFWDTVKYFDVFLAHLSWPKQCQFKSEIWVKITCVSIFFFYKKN